ncbi:MAG: ATP-binding protein, partial [Methylococcaceae bacterium]
RRFNQLLVIHDESAILIREKLVTAREEAVALLEKTIGLHDWKDASLKPEIDGSETLPGKPDNHIKLLQQANSRLVIATIEAQKIAEQVHIAKAKLQIAKSLAETANLAKSDFLSSMSHELRTPLNAILGFAQLLVNGSPPATPVQVNRLEQITKAGWYLLELINQILDLATIESGKISLSQEPVKLSDIMLECRAMMEPLAQQHDIKLTFLPFDNSWFVNADRTRLKQVVINLLSNGVKYNREHGSVEVKCDLNTPERIRISIKDSGMGIPPEKIAQLFQPFNRLGQESGTEEGTGIGLIVTKRLVELMEGSIGMESNVGTGSEFWVDLNRKVMSQPATGNSTSFQREQAQCNLALKTLLYVEDNPANLMLVEQIIEEHTQLSFLSAADGSLGIALARVHHPDVILMDINLPGLNGYQALKILREDPATTHIPVIAISANAMPLDIGRGLEAGFFRYLTKPINIKEFLNVLGAALKLSKTVTISETVPDKVND